jgi:hypothetical protein
MDMATTTHKEQAMKIITIPVTINGDTRPVEFVFQYAFAAELADTSFANWESGKIAACRVGNGTKMHGTTISATQYADRDKIDTHVPIDRIHQMLDGTYLVVGMTAAVRNRWCDITDWADNVAAPDATAQTYYGSIQQPERETDEPNVELGRKLYLAMGWGKKS